MWKKGTPASPATALASSVLPVPGGPTSSTPLGMRAPKDRKRSGYFRNSTISCKLDLRFFYAGHVGEGDRGAVEGHHSRPAAAKAEGLIVTALGLAHHKQYQPAEEYQRQEVEQQPEEAGQPAGAFGINLDAAGSADLHSAFQLEAR